MVVPRGLGRLVWVTVYNGLPRLSILEYIMVKIMIVSMMTKIMMMMMRMLMSSEDDASNVSSMCDLLCIYCIYVRVMHMVLEKKQTKVYM